MVEVLSKLYDEHHVLSVAFWKSVKVVFKNRQFALVPSSVFLKEEADAYLSLNAAVDQDRDKVMYYKHSQHKAVNVFASEQIVLDFLRDKYPNGNLQVFHQSSALVEGLMKYDDHSSQRTMFLYIDRFYLHIAVCKDHQLEYYNLFSIRKSEDYVRYILGVMQAMKMSQSKAKVVLWGFIKPQSNHFKFLHKYVRNLSFGQRPEFLKFSFDFDELHDNQYFDVLNAYLCE